LPDAGRGACPLLAWLVAPPYFQTQNAAQDALPVAWALLGELVGFALQEKEAVANGS